MKHRQVFRRGHRRTKSVLRLLDLEHAKSALLNSLTSPDAQRGYRHAIDEFVDWYCSEPRLAFNRIVVLRYRSHLESRQLAPGTVNLRLGAVRRLAYEAADCGLLSSDLAAGIRRVKGVKKLGVRLGNWLTAQQGQALWQAPGREQLKGKRDRALLALLLACGLRRRTCARLCTTAPRPELCDFNFRAARHCKHQRRTQVAVRKGRYMSVRGEGGLPRTPARGSPVLAPNILSSSRPMVTRSTHQFQGVTYGPESANPQD